MQNMFKITQQTHQRWINVATTLIVNIHQRCFKSCANVHLTTLFQRWQNNLETMLIELRRFNVDEPTLFQHWNLVENESWADVCLSTLFQRWQNNVKTTLKELRWFNVDDPMLFQRWYLVENGKLSQRMFFGVEKTALKKLCQYLLYWCSLESSSITNQN